MGIFLFADRRLQGNRLLRNLQNLPDFGYRNVHALCDFLACRLAAEFLDESTRRPDQFVDRLDLWNSTGPRLVWGLTTRDAVDLPTDITSLVRGKEDENGCDLYRLSWSLENHILPELPHLF